MRRIKNIVQRHRQFDHAKSGAKMTSGFGHSANRCGSQFASKTLQFALGQAAQIINAADFIE
jgi:hypothetical protein